MSKANDFLFSNLQKWTPFSVLVVLAGCACLFIIVWDIIYGIPLQPAIIGIITLLVGSTGTATLVQHGVNVANGVANSTAAAVIQAQANATAPLPSTTEEEKKP